MRRIYTTLAVAFLCLISCKEHIEANSTIAIIPQPTVVEESEGVFTLSPRTAIILHFEAEQLADAVGHINAIANDIFGRSLAIKCSSENSPKENVINIYQDRSIAHEGYRLCVSKSSIDITSSTANGVFYAIQSLRQMLPHEALTAKRVKSVNIPAVKIEDAPHFTYRGVLLDVCRHFFTADEVKTIIDIAAMHKINHFHWHLTDDQGWRIEIKRYPLLTEVGSRRADSQVIGTHHSRNMAMEGVPYGPYFYTQEEIAEVVEYASKRFVTVVPEIDLPGHTIAALTAYPHLGCVGEGYKVREIWGIAKEVMCLGKESTFEFIENVLGEVLELFPSKYIHIGGDECPRDAWKVCPLCQARIKAEGLQNEAELQSYCNHRIEALLHKQGRKMIGWDEILEGGVSPTTTIMSWRGVEGGIAAAKAGNYAIMTPYKLCYLNGIQSADLANEPAFGVRNPHIPHHRPLDKVYNFNPYDGLTTEEQHYILGIQACVWTEHIKEFNHLTYMLLPRLSALAETAWSLPRKDWERYIANLENLRRFYEAYNYNYAISYWRDKANGIE